MGEVKDWRDIWRIWAVLGGPKPPINVLARLIPPSPDVEDVTRVDADAYKAHRLQRQRRLLRSVLLLARAYDRHDVEQRALAVLATLPRERVQAPRYTRKAA